MVRLVLFDIDGTLIQTGGAGVTAFGQALESEFDLKDATARINFSGRTDTGILREVFLQNSIDPSFENFRRFFDSYVFWLDHFLHQKQGRLCPHVPDFIRALEKLPHPPVLGLLTGNIRLGAEIKLRHFNIWERFLVGAFADDHEDRDQISSIAHRRGCELINSKIQGDEVLVIGDTPLDIQCGRSIGAQVLAVATGNYTLQELQKHRPDFACENLGEFAMHGAET